MSFKHILVYVDTHAENETLLDLTTKLAAHFGAKLKIVDTVPDVSWPMQLLIGGFERTVELLTGDKAGRLKELEARIQAQGIDVTTKLLDGRLSVALIREVLQDGHDLVIKRAKGHRSRRSGFFGTTATRLFRKCPCAVLATGPDSSWPWQRAVAAVDATTDDETHSALNVRIIDTAQLLRAASKCELDVVSAWHIHDELELKDRISEEELDDLRRKALADAEVRLDKLIARARDSGSADAIHSLHGFPEDAIQEFTEKHRSDLLVMGSVGRAGVTGLLIGNTAERILDRVQCSVLTIKPDSFVSPIKLN